MQNYSAAKKPLSLLISSFEKHWPLAVGHWPAGSQDAEGAGEENVLDYGAHDEEFSEGAGGRVAPMQSPVSFTSNTGCVCQY
jgi:hypothetical protein